MKKYRIDYSDFVEIDGERAFRVVMIDESRIPVIAFNNAAVIQEKEDGEKFIIGGHIAHSDNLSQEGNCWVYDGAVVLGSKSRICEEACVYSGATIIDSEIFGDSVISGTGRIIESSIGGDAFIENSDVESCKIDGSASIYNADIIGSVISNKVTFDESGGRTKIIGSTIVDDVFIEGGSVIDCSEVRGTAYIPKNASLYRCTVGDCVIPEGSYIGSTGEIIQENHVMHLGNFFGLYSVTLYKTNDDNVEMIVILCPDAPEDKFTGGEITEFFQHQFGESEEVLKSVKTIVKEIIDQILKED